MRKKHLRYFLVKLVADNALTKESFHLSLRNSTTQFFGEVGLIEIGPEVIAFNQERYEAIVRCRKKAAEKFRAAIALITEINGKPAAALVMKTSGTVRALKEKWARP